MIDGLPTIENAMEYKVEIGYRHEDSRTIEVFANAEHIELIAYGIYLGWKTASGNRLGYCAIHYPDGHSRCLIDCM